MDKRLKNKIMMRVYAVWFLRKATGSFYLKLAVPATALWLATFYVSVSNVVANMPKGLNAGDYYDFTVSAFSKTEAATLAILSVAVISVAWLVKDSIKNLKVVKLGRVAA